jgi:hypothetical protein
MDPNILDEKERMCPMCGNQITEWDFMGEPLDNAVIDKESKAITFEVEIKCPLCEIPLYGIF